MATPDELAAAYAAAWTERDEVKRRALLEVCWRGWRRQRRSNRRRSLQGLDDDLGVAAGERLQVLGIAREDHAATEVDG